MARFSLPLLLLACTAAKDSGADCVSDDPCDCGVAWTERRGPVATIQDAVNGARSGETIYVCEGEIAGNIDIDRSHMDTEESLPELTVQGAGAAATTLLPNADPSVFPYNVVGIGAVSVHIENLTVSMGKGLPRVIDDTYNTATYGGGLFLCAASVYFQSVGLIGNEATLGGGLATWCFEGLTDITLIDSSVTDNSGRGDDEGYHGGGGAWLADDFVLTSINTDWGSGDTDNRDDDIAIGPLGGPYTTYADFGAAENFVCSSETQACTRTE